MHVSRPLLFWIVIGLIVISAIVGISLAKSKKNNQRTTGFVQNIVASDMPTTITRSTVTPKNTNEWEEIGAALAGTYADAEIVTLADGTYRMYAATQPEVAGNNLEIYSATSTDGITWTKEAGTRKSMATFPDVIKLDNGTYRMNYQNSGVIKSATSKDGHTFTNEVGTRIDSANDAGITFENVAAPSTLKLSDGTYLMVYRGSINEAYAAKTVPNKTMGVVMYATSNDAKTWAKKGLAIDTRTDTTLQGWADGPELIDFDGETRVYFSTYTGVYYSVFKDGAFTKPQFSWQLTDDDGLPNEHGGIPPGDPTLLKVGETWHMYYGRHPEGIYRATLVK